MAVCANKLIAARVSKTWHWLWFADPCLFSVWILQVTNTCILNLSFCSALRKMLQWPIRCWTHTFMGDYFCKGNGKFSLLTSHIIARYDDCLESSKVVNHLLKQSANHSASLFRCNNLILAESKLCVMDEWISACDGVMWGLMSPRTHMLHHRFHNGRNSLRILKLVLSPMCVRSCFTHCLEYFEKLIRRHKMWQNKRLAEASRAFIRSRFQGYRTTGPRDSPGLDSERPKWWNIPLHCGSGTGLYHIVLGKASAMSPSGGERQGEYIRGRFSTLGSDIRSPWERRDSLFQRTSDSRSPNDEVIMEVEMLVVREMPYCDTATEREMIYHWPLQAPG